MKGDMSGDSWPIWGGFSGDLEWQMTLDDCEGQSLDTLSLVARMCAVGKGSARQSV